MVNTVNRIFTIFSITRIFWYIILTNTVIIMLKLTYQLYPAELVKQFLDVNAYLLVMTTKGETGLLHSILKKILYCCQSMKSLLF